jgi:putative transposase
MKQAKFLNKNFGCVRFVWNALAANFNNYQSDMYRKDLSEKILKEENIFLKDAISYALQQKRIDFAEYKKQVFNKNRKKKIGKKAKFKKKGVCKDSFRIPAQSVAYMKGINFEAGTVALTKRIKIKCVYNRTFTGQVKSLTFSRTKTYEYYVSICVETEDANSFEKTQKNIGIDFGLKELITLSNGLKFENIRYYRENQAKLKRAQQHLSRKKYGSANYDKQRLKVAKIHEKIRRNRHWYYHNISKFLVENYDSICVESLNVSGMVQNRSLAKSISDASFSTLLGMIKYKADWYGKEVLQVGRFYPSSKLCSVCDHKVEDMNLGIRDWTCTSCGTKHDRDINAAVNVLNKCFEDTYGIIKT